MPLHERALNEAGQALFAVLGPLDDLSPELANTLANIFYKFYWVAYDPGIGPRDLGARDEIEFATEKLMISTLHIASEAIVQDVRRASPQNRRAVHQLALDLLKYRIDSLEGKGVVRRAIERALASVHEIPDLYLTMRVRRPAHNGRDSDQAATLCSVSAEDYCEDDPPKRPDTAGTFKITGVSEGISGKPLVHINRVPLGIDGTPELSAELADLLAPYFRDCDHVALRFTDNGLPTTFTAVCTLYPVQEDEHITQYRLLMMLFPTLTRKVGASLTLTPVRNDLLIGPGIPVSQDIPSARSYEFREVYNTIEEPGDDIERFARIAHSHFKKDRREQRSMESEDALRD